MNVLSVRVKLFVALRGFLGTNLLVPVLCFSCFFFPPKLCHMPYRLFPQFWKQADGLLPSPCFVVPQVKYQFLAILLVFLILQLSF